MLSRISVIEYNNTSQIVHVYVIILLNTKPNHRFKFEGSRPDRSRGAVNWPCYESEVMGRSPSPQWQPPRPWQWQ